VCNPLKDLMGSIATSAADKAASDRDRMMMAKGGEFYTDPATGQRILRTPGQVHWLQEQQGK
jgi:hypothetical protein